MKKVNYLNNKDLLEEIHKSKNSYSSFTEPEYHDYDIIVNDISHLTPEIIEEAKINKAKKLSNKLFEEKKASGDKKTRLIDCEIDPTTIQNSDLIFRVMTYTHIPITPGRKKTIKTTADKHEKVNFPPFQHWKFDDNNNLQCVGKSHWIGGMDNGYFSKDHGQFTKKLAQMFIDLADRYGTRRNVRNYSYNSEMRGQAILQLTQIGLQFDESKSNNPFAYYTSAVINSFVRIINVERKNQNIRDDILEMNSLNPSYTRQSNNEWEMMSERDNKPKN
jgi:hypothetical protein